MFYKNKVVKCVVLVIAFTFGFPARATESETMKTAEKIRKVCGEFETFIMSQCVFERGYDPIQCALVSAIGYLDCVKQTCVAYDQQRKATPGKKKPKQKERPGKRKLEPKIKKDAKKLWIKR